MQIAQAKTSAFEEITVIGRIEGQGAALRIIRSMEGDALPGLIQNQELEKKLGELQKGDEVLIKGYITYQSFSLEEGKQLTPIFIVQSLRPISLSRLGKSEDAKIPELQFSSNNQKHFSPLGIPVTTQVASAITLTSSMLLLQSLASGPNDVQIRQQLNSGLILFAGAMATGIFIYEQIKSYKTVNEDRD